MAKSKRNNQKRGKGPYEHKVVGMLQRARHPTTIFRYVLSYESALTSDGAGAIAGTIVMDPSGTAKWSYFAAIFDQFRVVGGQVSFVSVLPVNSSANGSLMRCAFDNDSTTTPTAYNDLSDYSEVYDMPCVWTGGGVKKFHFLRPFVGKTPQEGNIWYNETSPSSSPGGVKLYANGLSASVTYFKYFVDLLVEFQIRG